MKSASLAYGLALIVLGLASYALTGAVSATALIPAFFGLPVLLLALPLGTRPRLAPVLLVIALLGLGGSAPGLFKLGSVFDGSAERPAALISQSIMAALSVVYAVAWFRLRRGGDAPAG